MGGELENKAAEISDLKSAIVDYTTIDEKPLELAIDSTHLLGYRSGRFVADNSGLSNTSGSYIRTIDALPVVPGEYITITPSTGYNVSLCVFTEKLSNSAYVNNADNSAIFDSGVVITGSYTFKTVAGKYYYVSSNVKYTEISSSNIPTITRKSEIGAKFDEVDGEINNLGQRVDGLILTHWRDSWAYGTLNVSNGRVAEDSTPTNRIHTPIFNADGIIKIVVENGYKYEIAAYSKSDESYVGVWNGTSFVTSATWLTTDIYPANIGNYKFRVIAANSADTVLDVATAKTKIIFSEKTDTSLSIAGAAADALATGERISGIKSEMSLLAGKKIVNMGDSIFGYFEAPTDISSYLAQVTGAVCINCALGGTRAVTRSGGGTTKPFDLTSLVDAIISGDFTSQDAAISDHGNAFQSHFAALKQVDFSDVDILTISYGTNDYAGDNAIGNVNSDKTYFIGALIYAVTQMITEYPKLRVVFCTPIFRMMTGGVPADTYENTNGNTLTDFVDAVKTAAQAVHTYAIDLYYLGINGLNYQGYYIDSTHPDVAGRMIIANRISKNLC